MNLLKKIKEDFESFGEWVFEALLFERRFLSFIYITKDFLKLLFVILMFISAILAWPVYSYFEAKAYNNVTGKNVNTWDAMFLELRVANE